MTAVFHVKVCEFASPPPFFKETIVGPLFDKQKHFYLQRLSITVTLLQEPLSLQATVFRLTE